MHRLSLLAAAFAVGAISAPVAVIADEWSTGSLLAGVASFRVMVSLEAPEGLPGSDGGGCRLDPNALELQAAEILQAARLDALASHVAAARYRDLHRRWPRGGDPDERRREWEALSRQVMGLYTRTVVRIRLRIASARGGLCAVDGVAQLLRFTSDGLPSGPAPSRDQPRWLLSDGPTVAFAVPLADLERSARDRVEGIAASFAAAWLEANTR